MPSAGSRSAFCSRPPASTDTGTVYFFTSSLLFLTLHPGHCQTQTLAVLSHLQTPREQRPSTETSHVLSAQTSNRSVLGALAHWPPPASVCCSAVLCWEENQPELAGHFPSKHFLHPLNGCGSKSAPGLSVRRGFPTTCDQDTKTRCACTECANILTGRQPAQVATSSRPTLHTLEAHPDPWPLPGWPWAHWSHCVTVVTAMVMMMMMMIHGTSPRK